MRRDAQAGSAAVEVALAGPALLLLLAVLMFGGRNALATGVVEQAAVDAARAASLARTAAEAEIAAVAAADQSLADQDLACAAVEVDVDPSGISTSLGQYSFVTTTITCTLRLSDLALPWIPGGTTIKASASSAVDTYRERP